MKRYILFLLLFTFNFAFAQNLTFIGTPTPGTVMIGKGENIKKAMLDKLPLKIDDKGIFVFGFDRDDKGEHFLMVEYNNGDIETRKLVLEKRDYKIQRINNMASKYVTPPKKELPRIAQEKKMMQQARREIGKDINSHFMSGILRPVKGGRVTGVFGSQRILNGVPKSPHSGYDIASPKGTPIYAMADGKVCMVGDNFYYNGSFVLLDHGQGLSSIYIHMSKTSVKDGQFVKMGDKIGEIGSTGRATGPHLHWGVSWMKKRIDPKSLLNLNFSGLNE